MRNIEDLVSGFKRPAVQLVAKAEKRRSYLGGAPTLTNSLQWPFRSGKPLTFLALIELPEIDATGAVPWLPKTGRLMFFYDVEEQP
jgi:uncharacterized protein YwqG